MLLQFLPYITLLRKPPKEEGSCPLPLINANLHGGGGGGGLEIAKLNLAGEGGGSSTPPKELAFVIFGSCRAAQLRSQRGTAQFSRRGGIHDT